jgi:hypothetical protein
MVVMHARNAWKNSTSEVIMQGIVSPFLTTVSQLFFLGAAHG